MCKKKMSKELGKRWRKRKKSCWRVQLVVLWARACEREGREFPLRFPDLVRDLKLFAGVQLDREVIEDLWCSALAVARMTKHGTLGCNITPEGLALLEWRTGSDRWSPKRKLKVLGYVNRVLADGRSVSEPTGACHGPALYQSIFDALLVEAATAVERDASAKEAP